MKKAVFQMEPFTCPSCIKKIENAVGKLAGVEAVTVLFHAGKVRVRYNETQITAQQLENTLVKLGYPVLSQKVA
ncbi:heavy-metal-associated domain-containing protein [Planococcus salinus]|uniref:Copper chaperone n=1 Tax=Planococcus salinus TaxID=1848460 RepID=A0A3M8PBS1_9BACL|nr:heavy-metal-associated domain-containing protein [Planococcus salinus]RNF41157.1 copper chaperone [Planococcus salinus]